MSNAASHSVRLNFSGTATATVNAHWNKPFDIVVPAFASDNVTITLITNDGQYCELPLTGNSNGVELANNTVTTVTVNVTELSLFPAAELVDGLTFNATIPTTATSMVFEYNSSITSEIVLSTPDSPTPIYGYLDGTVWRITTSAPIINANQYCSLMFAGIWDDEVGSIISNIISIDFGRWFNTSSVFDMNGMFWNCSRLGSLDLSCFNTSNVGNMESMFDGCSILTSLDLSNFNTSNVRNMCCMFYDCNSLMSLDLSNFNTPNIENIDGMFWKCSSLTSLDLSHFDMNNVICKDRMCSNPSYKSGNYMITCSLEVENAIKEENPDYNPFDDWYLYYITGLPTNGVNFTWVRPSSSK